MRPFRPGESGYVGPGITFLRTPLVLDPEELTDVDVAILGAPFDEGVTYRPGARFGPRAIRLADHSGIGERTHMEVGVDPKAVLKIVDFGDIEAPPSDLLKAHALLRSHVGMILNKGAVPVVLGGDHSLSAPMMQAIADCHGPDGYAVIHFDTHADTGFLDEPKRDAEMLKWLEHAQTPKGSFQFAKSWTDSAGKTWVQGALKIHAAH